MSNLKEAIPASEFMKKNLGISEAPAEAYLNYGYALLAIAGADGKVSEAELNWLLNHQRIVGAPEELIEKYKTFDYKNADLENLLSKIRVDVSSWSKSRSLLYHAIQMSRADNDYSIEEQKAVKKAAKLLKVEDDVALALNRLIETEEAVTALRKALLQTEVLA
ncbi:TerB family tellurite resistance protein [Nostoc sp. UCD121]|uniref:TerB family tellurite resistance protein n=1 Tax=unclassified Nostoc TaxID=2593658 RepID=UPI0016247607|nr:MULTISPECIES: TerB family tellurite resistance protein [unclassified Nostoc]MBC1222390.1 TerB family tellurite resistance protein [Nostoc sp. UCD120]MBC1275208.1 TerB family tellurite resistance protein [Nostoc sp. UCD121]MBC1294218.1 TerB family tellurite resistance protein [Nostoc sp. UCD122]